MRKSERSADYWGAMSAFVAVAEYQSLTKAAGRLEVSLSSVSKAITRLEAHVGVQLVKRTSRSVRLTEEGSIYYDTCKRVLAELEDAERALFATGAEPRGKLRLQMPRALGSQVVIPALTKFLTKHSAITVDVLLDGKPFNLEHEGIDLALRYGVSSNSQLVAQKLAPVTHMAYAAPDYINRFGEPETPDDLLKHRCINNIVSHGGGRYRRWKFNDCGKIVTLDVASVLNIEDTAIGASAAVKGLGIVYLSNFTAAAYVRAGTLVPLMPQYAFDGESLYMLYPRRRHVSRRETLLRDFLRELFAPRRKQKARTS